MQSPPPPPPPLPPSAQDPPPPFGQRPIGYDHERQRWGLGEVWLGLAAGIVFQTIAVVILVAVTDYEADLDDVPMWLFAIVNATIHLGLFTLVVLAGRKGLGWIRDFTYSARARDIVPGVLLGVACQVAVGLLYLPFFEIFDKDVEEVGEPARNLSERATDVVGELSLIVLVGFIAPFIEEIFFRGLLFRALDKRFDREAWGRRAAIGLSALVFAGYHLQLLQFPALFLLGLVLAYVTHRRGDISMAIWIHVGFNMTTVLALLYGPDSSSDALVPGFF